MHDYYSERYNNKQCTNIGTTIILTLKGSMYQKIKCTSQETQTEHVREKHIPVGMCICSKSKESDIEMMRNFSAEARTIMETPEKLTLKDSFEYSHVCDCSLIQSLKVNTSSNASPVRTSPMIESLHKQNKEKACATRVPSYSQVIKFQNGGVIIKESLKLARIPIVLCKTPH